MSEQTIDTLIEQCRMIADDETFSPLERKQRLNLLRREVFYRHGAFSEEFRKVDDYVMFARLSRSA